MPFPIRIIIPLLALCLASMPARAAEAHVHGQARLAVAIDGGTLTLLLASPADSLTGFEHSPRTAQEHAAVAAMRQHLERADALFQPSPAAACRLSGVTLVSPLLGDAPEPGHAGHADLDGTFVFRCAHPERLNDLDVRLFERFPRLKRLNVEIAGPNGQKALQLRAGQTRAVW